MSGLAVKSDAAARVHGTTVIHRRLPLASKWCTAPQAATETTLATP